MIRYARRMKIGLFNLFCRWVELASRGERGEEVDSEVIIEDNGEATKDGVTQVAMTDEEHKMDVQRDWEGDGKGTI